MMGIKRRYVNTGGDCNHCRGGSRIYLCPFQAEHGKNSKDGECGICRKCAENLKDVATPADMKEKRRKIVALGGLIPCDGAAGGCSLTGDVETGLCEAHQRDPDCIT